MTKRMVKDNDETINYKQLKETVSIKVHYEEETGE